MQNADRVSVTCTTPGCYSWIYHERHGPLCPKCKEPWPDWVYATSKRSSYHFDKKTADLLRLRLICEVDGIGFATAWNMDNGQIHTSPKPSVPLLQLAPLAGLVPWSDGVTIGCGIAHLDLPYATKNKGSGRGKGKGIDTKGGKGPDTDGGKGGVAAAAWKGKGGFGTDGWHGEGKGTAPYWAASWGGNGGWRRLGPVECVGWYQDLGQGQLVRRR